MQVIAAGELVFFERIFDFIFSPSSLICFAAMDTKKKWPLPGLVNSASPHDSLSHREGGTEYHTHNRAAVCRVTIDVDISEPADRTHWRVN